MEERPEGTARGGPRGLRGVRERHADRRGLRPRRRRRQTHRHRAGGAQGEVQEGVSDMAIITISHEMGAGGPEIGQLLAQRLGYRYVDQELISDAAQRYGLLEEKLSHLDESKPSLFERFDAETRRYITVIQTALLRVRRAGQRDPDGPRRAVAPPGHPARAPGAGDGALRPAGEAPGQEAGRPDGRADQPARRWSTWSAGTTPRSSGGMRYLYEVDIRDPPSTTSSSTPRSCRPRPRWR